MSQSLSLSPRYDLFRFMLPDNFLCDYVKEKYNKKLAETPGIIDNAMALLNESIQEISFPGIENIAISQSQTGINKLIDRTNGKNGRSFGKINIEPNSDIYYMSPANPISSINKQFTVTFRHIQGLRNYFMIYEEILLRYEKPVSYRSVDKMHPFDPEFKIELLSETGTVIASITLMDVYISGISGLDFSFSKEDRNAGTFTVTFVFNNIKYNFLPD